MTRKEQRKFVKELVGNVEKGILKKLYAVPETWNGIELRWLIADHFRAAEITRKDKDKQTRVRSYRNDVLVLNLV